MNGTGKKGHCNMKTQFVDTIIGNDVNNVIRDMITEISTKGVIYQSSEHSMNRSNSIQEVFNAQIVLSNPRKRILNSDLPLFNPGLAAARFIYMLSGSNLLEPIAFYSKAASHFSDDGIIIPGSSYGSRIFGSRKEGNQFEFASKIILNRSDTKRAVIDFHSEHDLARLVSRDIPCALNMSFMPRSNILHATLAMRANDAMRLMPYNIFEFTLLHECMAARVGLELGNYWHTAVSMHIRGENIIESERLIKEPHQSCAMQKISSFSEALRLRILAEEVFIRTKGTDSKTVTLNQVNKFWGEYSAIWSDLLTTLACEAFRLYNKEDLQWITEITQKFAEENKEAVLVKAYSKFLYRLVKHVS